MPTALEGDYYRIVVDSGNYREKREKTLENLAKKLSSQVIRTGRSVTLEPMNPYERRVIHATIQGIDGVTSSSVGEGAFPPSGHFFYQSIEKKL